MNKLAEFRVRKGLTVRQLADASGVSPTTISRLEMGKIKSHPVTIGRLANALKVDLNELMEFALLDSKSDRLTTLSNQAA